MDLPIKQSFHINYHLYAGEYPGAKDEPTAREKIEQMIAFGVRYFVDLTEEGELAPYAHLLPKDAVHLRFPIRDVSVPGDVESVAELIRTIHQWTKRDDGAIYIHCWGGVGRTGTIVACWLAEEWDAPTLEDVLKGLRARFQQMPKSAYRQTPETREQEAFIGKYISALYARRAAHKAFVRDCIRGCLIGGALGDALGYPVEFMSRLSILSRYGASGITQLELSSNGQALISDDTQMTLFTANGLLMGLTRGCMRGIGAPLATYVDGAYLDWYYTQTGRLKPHQTLDDYHYTWLRDLPELAHRRAPGTTCLQACEAMLHREKVSNNSKGCGGVMRVAPMGLLAASFEVSARRPLYDDAFLAAQGAHIARVTHLHPLGYLPAALMTLLIARLTPLTPDEAKTTFVSIVEEALTTMMAMEAPTKDKEVLRLITLHAIRLAQSDTPDIEAIEILGEGWVAEEAWAVSLFCALRHIDNPRQALISAVNHDGDSDSTGSITGNIIGAIYGYEALRAERLLCPEGQTLESCLELHDLILSIADDLSQLCPISEYSPIDTPEKQRWYARYCEMKNITICDYFAKK